MKELDDAKGGKLLVTLPEIFTCLIIDRPRARCHFRIRVSSPNLILLSASDILQAGQASSSQGSWTRRNFKPLLYRQDHTLSLPLYLHPHRWALLSFALLSSPSEPVVQGLSSFRDGQMM
jgi:hypothetical protein